MIILTPSARQHISRVLAEASASVFRIALSQKGCSGYAYDMSVHVDSEVDGLINAGDLAEDCQGVTIFFPAKDAGHLRGIELNWVQEGFSSRLAVTNPNVKNECGCGASVMF